MYACHVYACCECYIATRVLHNHVAVCDTLGHVNLTWDPILEKS